MCMLFMFLNDGTDHQVGYKMVLISNRDEYWERPTDPANFRGDDNLWIGGIDLEPGREGGTWLGMNRQGQVAVLLNILAIQEPNKKGRGNLVTDFVTNTKISCEEYLDSVATDQTSYNPFQLILTDLREQSPSFYYLNNVESSIEHSRKILHQKTLAVDNSINSCNIPWCKTQNGRTKFLDILQNYGDIESKDILIEKCIDLLNDKTQCFPDLQLQQQFEDVGRSDDGCIIEERSALNVFSPSIKYGTRGVQKCHCAGMGQIISNDSISIGSDMQGLTIDQSLATPTYCVGSTNILGQTNTVILVDKDGNCDYVERTLETPVNVENPEWKTVKYRFKLEKDRVTNDGASPNL